MRGERVLGLGDIVEEGEECFGVSFIGGDYSRVVVGFGAGDGVLIV